MNRRISALCLLSVIAGSSVARADGELPPWVDRADIPLPTWAVSVQPKRDDTAIYSEPGRLDLRRGSSQDGTRFPLFAAKRAPGCTGRWLQVAAFAWICGDAADLSGEAPKPPIDVGTPKYFFAGREGAFAYVNPATADDSAADQELAPAWALGIVEERDVGGERWGRTRKGLWIRMRELGAAKVTKLHGEAVSGPLNVAWVVPNKAPVFASAKVGKVTREAIRYDLVRVT